MKTNDEWHYIFIKIANIISTRSTCLRRQYGAIIVDNDSNQIVGIGYNTAPSLLQSCAELKTCYRKDNNIPHGQQYEQCRAIHAEQNAVLNASLDTSLDSRKKGRYTMYIAGNETIDGKIIPIDSYPCKLCCNMILNTGCIHNVIIQTKYDFKTLDLYDLESILTKK